MSQKGFTAMKPDSNNTPQDSAHAHGGHTDWQSIARDTPLLKTHVYSL